jgi:hypothetical protein
MTVTYLQAFSAITALLAAVFWGLSALVHIPDMAKTKISGEGSLTHILRKQARLSAAGATFAAISALFQAISLFLS